MIFTHNNKQWMEADKDTKIEQGTEVLVWDRSHTNSEVQIFLAKRSGKGSRYLWVCESLSGIHLNSWIHLAIPATPSEILKPFSVGPCTEEEKSCFRELIGDEYFDPYFIHEFVSNASNSHMAYYTDGWIGTSERECALKHREVITPTEALQKLGIEPKVREVEWWKVKDEFVWYKCKSNNKALNTSAVSEHTEGMEILVNPKSNPNKAKWVKIRVTGGEG